jgi:hypothetical protein
MKLGSVPKKSWPKDVATLKKNKSRWQENNKRKLKSKPRPRLTTSNQRSKTSEQRSRSWNQSTTLEGKPMRPSLRKRPWRRSLSKTDMLKKPKLNRSNKWLRRNNLKPLQSVRLTNKKRLTGSGSKSKKNFNVRLTNSKCTKWKSNAWRKKNLS